MMDYETLAALGECFVYATPGLLVIILCLIMRSTK
jgi:hypothetical protein